MSKSKTKNIENYRYERKFVISSKHITKNEIENIIKLHPAVFREIYSERYVRNIYFDLIGFDNYVENIDGNTYKYHFYFYKTLLLQ